VSQQQAKPKKPLVHSFNMRCSLRQDLHNDLISKRAKLGFRSGDPESGRTLFENLLATFKKKSGLYNMFLVMGIKCGSEEGDGKEDAKALFKRPPAEKTSTHQAKALFQCSQPSRPDCRALASNSPVRPGRGWYGRPGKASVLDINCRTVG